MRVPAVEAGFAEGERVTQFEAATATAFVALAEAGVEVGVIEAGLGGRLDATNVLRSRATVLTSIGLDHTAWLGETELEIAAEKLAVLREGSTLVLGEVSAPVAELARETAAERGCAVVEPEEPPARCRAGGSVPPSKPGRGARGHRSRSGRGRARRAAGRARLPGTRRALRARRRRAPDGPRRGSQP